MMDMTGLVGSYCDANWRGRCALKRWFFSLCLASDEEHDEVAAAEEGSVAEALTALVAGKGEEDRRTLCRALS